MRRTALTIAATIVGLVLLLQFKVQSLGTSTGGLATLGTTSSTSQGTTPSTPRAKTRHRSSAPKQQPSHRPSAATTPTASGTVTATGQTVQTRYGPVQVRIVETAGKLTDVTAVRLPSDNPRSSEIAANAVPILRGEAIRADSAHIDIVSGATYTSDGYAQSLQSALDNA